MSERHFIQETSVRWEYASSNHLDDAMLNEYGGHGWELVSVHDGYAYFKRPMLIDGDDAR